MRRLILQRVRCAWGARLLRLRRRAAVAFCAAVLAPRAARADDQDHVRKIGIEVGAGAGAVDGCPDAAELAAAANRALGRDAVRIADAGAVNDDELRIAVAFSREPEGYGATVREAGASSGERILRTREPTCSTLTSALGVAVAMMIDAAEASKNSQSTVFAATTSGEARTPAPPASWLVALAPPQGSDRRTAFDGVYLEALGNGVYDSLNYERILGDRPFTLGVRVGFGYALLSICGGTGQARAPSSCSLFGSSSRRVDEFSAPVLGNWYWGSANHKLQVGLGLVGIYRTGDALSRSSCSIGTCAIAGGAVDSSFSKASKGLDVAATALVGYRFIPAHGGPSFGGGFTPLLGARGFLPWFSLSVGFQFW